MAISVASCIISIHAPREGSDGRLSSTTGGKDGISIHAPREGSDVFQSGFHTVLPISIHAPREGSDFFLLYTGLQMSYFYPRSPRGERPPRNRSLNPGRADFYPRSPRGERPAPPGRLVLVRTVFLSTLPARGATCALPWQ